MPEIAAVGLNAGIDARLDPPLAFAILGLKQFGLVEKVILEGGELLPPDPVDGERHEAIDAS